MFCTVSLVASFFGGAATRGSLESAGSAQTFRENPYSAHMWPTSQTGPQTVVVSVQQAVQDPGEQGDVGVEGVGRGVGAH